MEDRAATSEKFYDEYTIEISRFESNMTQLLAFLHELRRLPGLMQAADLNVSTAKGENPLRGSMRITKIMLPAGRGPGSTN